MVGDHPSHRRCRGDDIFDDGRSRWRRPLLGDAHLFLSGRNVEIDEGSGGWRIGESHVLVPVGGSFWGIEFGRHRCLWGFLSLRLQDRLGDVHSDTE